MEITYAMDHILYRMWIGIHTSYYNIKTLHKEKHRIVRSQYGVLYNSNIPNIHNLCEFGSFTNDQ